ncbi:lincosamide nucleotidyltransferase A/C/D/E [Microbacterium sp. AK009]|nr:aminoglycoside nucleotidyltransferase [Microbacterium sp. AK009]NYF17846.1 lincosamide nucleotidyltransferase A/C/D/E [Microbacterium sp. AK009]
MTVDGGWGVDALLGGQTREHGDLDLAVPAHGLDRIVRTLRRAGFERYPRSDDTEFMFVMAAGAIDVDLHAFAFASDEQVASVGVAYPRAALTGHGAILGRPVRCIAADGVIRFHSGYEPDDDDLADVRAVAQAFDLPLLPEHRRSTKG